MAGWLKKRPETKIKKEEDEKVVAGEPLTDAAAKVKDEEKVLRPLPVEAVRTSCLFSSNFRKVKVSALSTFLLGSQSLLLKKVSFSFIPPRLDQGLNYLGNLPVLMHIVSV